MDVVLELHGIYRGNERRIVNVMVAKIRDNLGEYPKLEKWLKRSFATQQVKQYTSQLRKNKLL